MHNESYCSMYTEEKVFSTESKCAYVVNYA